MAILNRRRTKTGSTGRHLARFPGTLVIYMGVTHLAAICRTLLKLGKPGDTPAAVIESGTLAWQHTVVGTLATIAEAASRAAVRPPALLVIGSVVGTARRALVVRAAAALWTENRGHAAAR